MTDKQATTTTTDNDNCITLDEPIKRGDTTIERVSVRKPGAGELRGVTLMDLAQMDVTALQKVLPRITDPTLAPHEIERLDPADLMQLGVKAVSFLLTKQQRAEASLQQ